MPAAESFNHIALASEIASALVALPDRTTGAMRTLRRGYSNRLAKERGRDVVALALHLMESPVFWNRFVAYELVGHHREALASLTERDLKRFGRGLDSWWTVDTFASYLSGPAWREGRIGDDVVMRWACSRDRWWRRTALVSTVPLNIASLGGSGDTERTLMVCEALVADHDDMVVKALSWALRVLSKRDGPAVIAFLDTHRPLLHSRVLREVGNKLRTGLKNPKGSRNER